ncbi:MAG: SIMPL domain-containing protein [Flavobacteriales bacterium]|nr:SIMPL domain-containing protein [Flavobacteriales bacterium]
MQRTVLPFALFLSTLLPLAAQPQPAAVEPPHIEVTGRAEIQVVPDEIHISIELRERGSGKDKVSVDKQEVELKDAVKALGIDGANLTLSDAMADLVPKKFRDDDVIARKGYMLKVADAEMVRKVFLELDRLQIEDAFIHHVSHSKEVQMRREQRIKAIKAAKEKADYLLEAIGEKAGAATEVREVADADFRGNVQTRQLYANELSVGYVGSDYQELGVGFSRITISAEVYVKFGIAAR